ncbi:MAG: outer membrane protein assembly factor BamB family protein [Planctomycetota bacterium]|jgi:hypothetical protein
MRTFLILALCAGSAAAGDTDGGNAEPRRWTHARGPASRSCVSQAKPVSSLGATAWTYKAKAPIAATPLTWDGTGFLLEGETVVAIDLESGKRLASQRVGTAGSLTLGDGAVFVREADQIVQWRRHQSGFRRRWSKKVGADASAPCVHEGEIYLTSEGKLLRLRVGQDKPAWSQGTKCFGAPALYGEEIYALELVDGNKAALVARARLDGSERARVVLGEGAKDGIVALNFAQACVRLGDRWVMVRRTAKDGALKLEKPWKVRLTEAPLVYRRAVIGVGGKAGALMLYRYTDKKDIQRPMISPKNRADLLKGAGWPISMQTVFCNGLWAADINANRIRWHLHERPDRPLLKDGVAFRPVPATDERLLIVSHDRKSVICIAPEVIG